MTENEAIEILREKYMDIEYHFAEHDCYMEEYDTEFQEAIETATKALKEIQQYRSIGTIEEIEQISRDLKRQMAHSDKLSEVLKSTKNLLEKREDMLKKYCEIGIVEECREATERQRAKKPILQTPNRPDEMLEYNCPECGEFVCHALNIVHTKANKTNYCMACGCKLDWSDNE